MAIQHTGCKLQLHRVKNLLPHQVAVIRWIPTLFDCNLMVWTAYFENRRVQPDGGVGFSPSSQLFVAVHEKTHATGRWYPAYHRVAVRLQLDGYAGNH